MSPLTLDRDPKPPEKVRTLRPVAIRQPRLTLEAVHRPAFPLRGLVYSFLLHGIFLDVIMTVPASSRFTLPNPPKRQWETTIIPKGVLYLPQLGGGKEGGSPKKAVTRASHGNKSSPAVAANHGVTYAGPQHVVSNPPNPTNHIQTILQPDLPHPPILKAFVPLPNLVTLAQALPPPPSPPPPAKPAPKVAEPPPQPIVRREPQVRVPVISLPGPRPVEVPKLTLPATPANPSATLADTPAPPPAAPPAPPQKAPEAKPATPQALPVGQSKSAHDLLALSPVPDARNNAANVPEGEARGQFAISPLPSSNRSSSGLGSGDGNNNTKTLAVGAGSGAVEIAGAGDGEGSGGSGAGGAGAGSGPGPGHGSGTSHGTGAGGGPGPGPFAGMTIQGAEGPAGGITISGASPPPADNHAGGSYGLTIVTTGNSGGGVGDFGIFRNEAVFTVYMDSAETADDPAPHWALQYAVLNPAGAALQDLLPPVPLKKRTPVWPPDQLARFAGQQIAVYAVIDEEGKIRHFKVLQSPNYRLGEIILTVLDQWTFRPATMNGKPVAVKVVLGIPVSSGP